MYFLEACNSRYPFKRSLALVQTENIIIIKNVHWILNLMLAEQALHAIAGRIPNRRRRIQFATEQINHFDNSWISPSRKPKAVWKQSH